MWVFYLVVSILLTLLGISLFIYWMVILAKKDYYGYYSKLYYRLTRKKTLLMLLSGYIGLICITVWLYSLMVSGYKEATLNHIVADTVNVKENITKVHLYNNQPISELDNKKFKNYEITNKLKYKNKIYLGIGTKKGIVLLELDKEKVPDISNTLDYMTNVTINLDNSEIHKIVYVQNIFDKYTNTTVKQRENLMKSTYKNTNNTMVDVFDIKSDSIQELKDNISTKQLPKELSKEKYNVLDKYQIEKIRFN